jgi:hypothetical protein
MNPADLLVCLLLVVIFGDLTEVDCHWELPSLDLDDTRSGLVLREKSLVLMKVGHPQGRRHDYQSQWEGDLLSFFPFFEG